MDAGKTIAWKAGAILRGSTLDRRDGFAALMAICHAKLLALNIGTDLRGDVDHFSENLADFVRNEEHDGQISHFVEDALLSKRYLGSDEGLSFRLYTELPDSAEELSEIILDLSLEEEWLGSGSHYEFATPGSVTDLAIALLGIDEDDTVADFGVGTGCFLVKTAQRAHCKSAYGCDITTFAVEIAKIRAACLGPEAVIEQADMFHIDGTFDKCFSNYPFGMKKRGFAEDALHNLAAQGFDGLPKIASSDWLFNTQLLVRTNEGGKAIGIMTRGSGFNKADEQIRRHFLANGWIEAVIALPEGIFSPYTKVATNMVVLSRGNEAVRLVDAADICQRGRRRATFSEDDVSEIVRLMEEDADGLSCIKSFDDLASAGFNLNPARYLEKEIAVKNGAALESLASNITRGAHLTKDALETLNSNAPTKFRYLELKNIVDGEIEEGLGYLTGIEPSQERYCVADGDLLISKTGPNFKIAVAEFDGDERVLATANLYVVRIDRAKADPWYVKLYLESGQGMGQLERACVGTAQLNFPASGFSEVMIPMLDLSEQRAIVDKYMKLRQEIAVHRLAIERAQHKVANLLEDE